MQTILNKEVFGSGTDLVFIHGWASQNAVWRTWTQENFAQNFRVHLIDLPGFGSSPKLELEKDADVNAAWLDALEEALPEKFILIGWSLGGLMAQQLALRLPERTLGLICLASSPKFMRGKGWINGISPELLVDFFKALSSDSLALLKKFWKLQLQGGVGVRELMRSFVATMQENKLPSFTGLWQGLELLRDLDLRDDLARLTTPTYWLLGEFDPLVPQEIQQELLTLQPQAKIQLIENAGHTPFLTHSQETADFIRNFLQENGYL